MRKEEEEKSSGSVRLLLLKGCRDRKVNFLVASISKTFGCRETSRDVHQGLEKS